MTQHNLQVPEELIKAGAAELVDYSLADTPDRDRAVAERAAGEALQAILPKVRERLEAQAPYSYEMKYAVAWCFERAFPPEPHLCFDCGHPVRQHSGQREAGGCMVCGCKRCFEVFPPKDSP